MDPPDTTLCQLHWNRVSAETQWNLLPPPLLLFMPPPSRDRRERLRRNGEEKKSEEFKYSTCACTFSLCVYVCNLQETSPARSARAERPTGILLSICSCLSLSFTSCLSSLVSVYSLWLQRGTVIQEDIISCQH